MAMDKEMLLQRLQSQYLTRQEVLFKLPLNISISTFWPELVERRKMNSVVLPLHRADGKPMWYVLTDKMIAASERLCALALDCNVAIDPYKTAMTGAMTEEIFFTSFVEGAQITLQEAMEFLERGTEPENVQEQMIQNNRQAWTDMIRMLYYPLDERYVRMLAYRLTDEQLQWRRWCIANNCGGSLDMFRQEYPASPGEAFLHSGTGVFDNEQIVLRLERLPGPAGRGEFTDGEWSESETGAITLYELPEEGVPYVLGGDTAGEGSDYFTAIVIDNVTGRIAAKLRQKYSEPEYVRQIYALGRFYNDALVAIETNFSTYPVMKLQEMEYPNQYSREREDTYTRQMRKSYGFRTDRQSRPRAIANLVEVFSSHPEWFTDRDLLEEMLTFCYNEDHRPEALAGKHDDLVMGAAITYAVRHQQRMTVLTEPEKPREKLIDQMKRQKRARKAW